MQPQQPPGSALAGRRADAGTVRRFDIQILWSPPTRQATFRATITDTTPGIVADLLTRASNDPPTPPPAAAPAPAAHRPGTHHRPGHVFGFTTYRICGKLSPLPG